MSATGVGMRALATESAWDRRIGEIDVLFGAGRLDELGAAATRVGGERILLVTDPGLVDCGHAGRAQRLLVEAGFSVAVFDAVSPNPTTEHVAAGTELARSESIDMIVALGGGSAMDCAKGINFLVSNGGRMEDYWGLGKAREPMLPALGVPTTAGTGSDAQSYALISQAGSYRKMACGDPKARFRAVILDPDLVATVPAAVAAAAGMDALSHALESFVTSARTPRSTALSQRAFELLDRSVESLVEPPAPARQRARALLGAHLAGAAIEESMLGAAHATANPLTARHGVVHGEAIGLMLPNVIRYNATASEDLYRELWPRGGAHLARRLEEIRRRLGLADRLRDRGVGESDIPALAAAACDEWTAEFNPRPVDRGAFEEIYAAAL